MKGLYAPFCFKEFVLFLKSVIFVLSLTLSLAPTFTEAKEKAKVYHVCKKTDSSRDILACAMYAEGRGEGSKGMMLIGNTIINRTNDNQFPDRIRGVVFQKKQFSYTHEGTVYIRDKKSWEKAQNLSKGLIYLEENFPELRSLQDPSRGAIYFVKKGHNISWVKYKVKTFKYKNHIFYRDKNAN